MTLTTSHTQSDLNSSFPFTGLSVFITGAGSGIGKAIAQQLFSKGATLVLNGRNPDKLSHLSHHLNEKFPHSPGRIMLATGDVSNPDTAKQIIQHALQHTGQIDVLINNAGICPPIGLLQELSAHDTAQTLDINLKGPIFMMQHALQLAMVPAGKGLIININSIVGKVPFPYWSVYNASKAGLKSVTDAVADEQRANGIRVCGIYPGAVDTPLWEQIEPKHRLDPEGMIPAESIASAVDWIMQQPSHVLINDITLTPLNPVV